MERINMEDARIRVEFRKNETDEVIKTSGLTSYHLKIRTVLSMTWMNYLKKPVEFEDIPEELQLPDSLPNETIDLCKYFYTEDDEYFKEAFFYWIDNYHYKLLDSDILDLINRAKDAYVGYYEDLQTFVEEMFNAEFPECTERIKYYIDFDLYEKELMYDYFEIDGHIFKQ